MIRKLILTFTLMTACGATLAAQTMDDFYPSQPSPYSGFRVGMLHVTGDIVPHMKSYYEMITPTLTQIGWQFDTKLRNLRPGLSLHLETGTMISGFEQDIALPSISSIVNWRWSQGVELGTGLVLAPFGGLALATSAGGIIHFGKKPVPVNLMTAINDKTVAISVQFNLFTSAHQLK